MTGSAFESGQKVRTFQRLFGYKDWPPTESAPDHLVIKAVKRNSFQSNADDESCGPHDVGREARGKERLRESNPARREGTQQEEPMQGNQFKEANVQVLSEAFVKINPVTSKKDQRAMNSLSQETVGRSKAQDISATLFCGRLVQVWLRCVSRQVCPQSEKFS